MSNVGTALNAAANALVIVAVLAFLAAPGSPLRQPLARWLENRAAARTLERLRVRLLERASKLGDTTADYVLVEFLDYECPACRQMHPHVADLASGHPAVLTIVVHFPLSRIHPHAEAAALAAVCAEDQGRFGPMHEYLMAATDWMAKPGWDQVARSTGILDLSRFQACLTGDVARARLASDREAALAFEVQGTPTFVGAHGIQRGTMHPRALRELAVK